MENEFLTIFKTVGMGTTIWSPLASGLLTGKYNNGIPEGARLSLSGFEWLKDRWMVEEKLNKVKQFSSFADELGIPMATLAIAWTIKNPNVTTTILGATKKEQLVENLKALEASEKLTPDVMQRIDDITQTKPKVPEY